MSMAMMLMPTPIAIAVVLKKRRDVGADAGTAERCANAAPRFRF